MGDISSNTWLLHAVRCMVTAVVLCAPSLTLGQSSGGAIRLLPDRLETGGGIYFAANSNELRAESFAVLEQVAGVLRNNPSITIEIQVHTDSRGSDQYNLRLSHQRAHAIYQILSQHNISAQRLSFQGYGETCPISSNQTAEGRRANRRVVFFRTDSGNPNPCGRPPSLQTQTPSSSSQQQ
jgi:outer membrane protein OmpA-like peptidoglycan-associated protein